ncbi:hypothetical protein V498_05930 [Pseudogymnoascus sp. VKM F-4517 (FW-2822)]|nr:hypothetical protein V498_05930 [Pseudogymnoascus sp. VKM F-4517 (FW-2822)]
MEHQAPLQIFTITQLELGSQLIWEPAVGTAEHDRLVDAYIPGPANLQQKRATIALDFFDTTAASTMPAPFCRTYLVATNTPEFAAGPSYSPAFAPTSSYSPSTHAASTPSSSFSASSSSLSSKSSKRSISSLSSAASASPAKRLPGFSIMTADGVDITNNQSRGPKTKAQREQAAKMRKLGACPACKRSKQKCEPSHHRPAPMSASSSQNPSSASSPWQSSGSASASTSPGSRASISPHTSFGQSFSPVSHAPKAVADFSFASTTNVANDFLPGDWGFLSDQLLADNNNMPELLPSDFLLDFDAAAVLDEDLAFFSAPASGDNVFPHMQDRPNMQSRGFEGGAWYDDFVLSSYFDGGDANASLSSAPASVGELYAQTQASSSTSPSGQSDSSHVPGALERDRGLSPKSSSGEMGGSSGSPELDLFRDRNVQTSDLVIDGTLWDNLQSDSSSPTHDPRTATPALQRQSSDDIVVDPSDPGPWAEPPNTSSTTPRHQTRVTPKHILAPTSRDLPHAVPYTTDMRVTDEGDLPPSQPSRPMAWAMAGLQPRMEHQKVLRDSRSEPTTSSHRPPSASASERNTQLQAAVARYLVSSASAPSSSRAAASGEDGFTSEWAADPQRTRTELQTSRSEPATTSSHRPPSAPASSDPNTQLHAAVARYLVSSASSPSSSRAAASGEDGHGELRDRHKALRKSVAPHASVTPTAVPATSQCAACITTSAVPALAQCTHTTPTTVPAQAQCAFTTSSTAPATVATPSRHSTGVLSGVLDGIRRRVRSFFWGGDSGVDGLIQGMGRLGVV